MSEESYINVLEECDIIYDDVHPSFNLDNLQWMMMMVMVTLMMMTQITMKKMMMMGQLTLALAWTICSG